MLGLPGGTGSGSGAGIASPIAYGGSGGTGGSDGTGPTDGSGVGGSGQGNSSYMGCLALAQAHTLSAGQGGEGGTTSYDLGLYYGAGGGGGGVLFDGAGPAIAAQNGLHSNGAQGGTGFGAGGGAGGWTSPAGSPGGNGASGFVYVEAG